eukprot:13699565-Alexandrium_andersonii.AAC.1
MLLILPPSQHQDSAVLADPESGMAPLGQRQRWGLVAFAKRKAERFRGHTEQENKGDEVQSRGVA